MINIRLKNSIKIIQHAYWCFMKDMETKIIKNNGLTTHLEKVTNLRNSAACYFILCRVTSCYAELLHSEGAGRMCAFFFLFLFFKLVL